MTLCKRLRAIFRSRQKKENYTELKAIFISISSPLESIYFDLFRSKGPVTIQQQPYQRRYRLKRCQYSYYGGAFYSSGSAM